MVKPSSLDNPREPVVRSAIVVAWALTYLGMAMPAQAQRVHTGFWIGFAPGGVAAAGEEGLGYPLYLRLGATVNQRLLLGVEAYNVIVNYYGGKSFGSVAAIALVYPSATSGVFIKPGVGLSHAQANCCGTTTGLAAILAVGYDLRLGKNFYLTPNIDLLVTTHDRPGEDPLAGAAAFHDTNPTLSFALGLTWH